MGRGKVYTEPRPCLVCERMGWERICGVCRKRRARLPKTFRLNLRYSQDENGEEVADFVSDKEATDYLAWIEAVVKHNMPYADVTHVLSPFMREVVKRYRAKGTSD